MLTAPVNNRYSASAPGARCRRQRQASPMSDGIRRITMQALTHCDVCCSGRHVEVGFTDHLGKPALLYVPHDSLRGLLLTLPAAQREASQRRGSDGAPDNVAPLAHWQLTRDAEAQSMVL